MIFYYSMRCGHSRLPAGAFLGKYQSRAPTPATPIRRKAATDHYRKSPTRKDRKDDPHA